MVCETWKKQRDLYLDGELPSERMRGFDAHLRGCASCVTDALIRVQLKRCLQAAGKRFAPRAEFRREVSRTIAANSLRRLLNWNWAIAVAVALTFVFWLGRRSLGLFPKKPASFATFTVLANLTGAVEFGELTPSYFRGDRE